MAPSPQPPFATYLLPSLSFPISFPFRRRQSSTTSTNIPELITSPTSTPSSSPPSANCILPSRSLYSAKEPLCAPFNPRTSSTTERNLATPLPPVLRCSTCSTDIVYASQIVSKGFTGRHGRAYLVSIPSSAPSHSHSPSKKSSPPGNLSNTATGRSQHRELLTGQHVVADVSCLICGTVLGWKYVDASEASQRYKIGKCILEMKRVGLGRGWEDFGFAGEDGEGRWEEKEVEEEVQFDSGDEDECEDLFAGVWDAEVVGKRRGKRVWKN